MKKLITNFFNSEEAATSVEYAVLLALIAAAIISAIQTVGGETLNFWLDSSEAVGDVLEN